jgi:hypothetical protein
MIQKCPSTKVYPLCPRSRRSGVPGEINTLPPRKKLRFCSLELCFCRIIITLAFFKFVFINHFLLHSLRESRLFWRSDSDLDNMTRSSAYRHGRTGRKNLGGRKEMCPTFSDCARPVPKKLFVEQINFGDLPPVKKISVSVPF